jgi:demethylmenaquinone methyltransferase / 2-methoxy-6-polyprenyl-1,4-benzoquinol methylase
VSDAVVTDPGRASTREVRELFDENAATYDRVNTVISLGLDRRWRGWAARRAVARPRATVLDAFAGTGLVGLRAARLGARVTLADASHRMLDVALERAAARHLSVTAVRADLTTDVLGIASGPFDAVTVVFGLRYLQDPTGVLRSLASLLAHDGRIVIIEFVTPDTRLLSRLAWLYFSRVLPAVAGSLAGDRTLYDTLVRTTVAMGPRERLEGLVHAAGLEIVESRPMGFGLVAGVVVHRTGDS